MISNDGESLLVFFPVERFVAKQVVGMAHLDDTEFTEDIVAMALHHQSMTPSER